MSKEDFGPYERIRELGSGATASVWLARVVRPVRNLTPGREVAVKVLHERWEPGSSVHDRFLREAEVGRLVLHPNVVRVLDAGVAELDSRLRSYIAMEVAEGQTLRELLEEGGGQPEALCRHIGREVALGLAAIHRAGMVHRDVKPENIMLGSDGRVKVMDLGVAQLRDASARVTRSGDFFGSMLYAAPEQVAPGAAALDGRTDLYALGWVLYELATGDHPLDGLDLGALLHAQIHEAPAPLGTLRPDTTPFFEALAETLLAKDVTARPSDGDRLASILAEGERSSWWRQWQRSRRRTSTAVPRRVRRKGETSVYGRGDELGRLDGAWRNARDGDGSAVLLRGEAGVGKSRLVEELLARIERDHPTTTILHGVYPSGAVASPGSAIRDAFRDRLGTDDLESDVAALLPDSPRLATSLVAYLRGEVLPDAAPNLPPDAMLTAFVRSAQALAAREPTVLVIEDLHYATDEDRAAFIALARGAPGHRLLLVGATRPDVDADWLDAFANTAHGERHDLARLDEEDVSSLLSERLRSEHAAAELAPFLARASDGNPFFLFELLRGMEQEGVLHAKPDGRWTIVGDPNALTVPEAVRIQIESRLHRLTPEERATVDAAAMCGVRFDPTTIAHLLGEPAIDVLRRLARIERSHALVHPQGSEMVFDHPQVQETLYESLPAPLRMEYHRMLAEALLEGEETSGEHAVQICDHLLAAEQCEQALPHLDDALAFLEGASRNAPLAALLERVLGVEGLVTGARRVRLLLKQAERLDFLGRKADLKAAIDEAMALAETLGNPGLQALALIERGKELERAGRPEEALDPLTRAISLASAAGDLRSACRAHGARGVVHELAGRLEEAEADERRRLELAWDLKDVSFEAAARGNLGQVLFYRGDLTLALEQFQESRRLFAESGDELAAARAAANLGMVLQYVGRGEEASEQFQQALPVYRRVGYRRGEANIRGNLGLFAQHEGRLTEALEHARHTLELQREVGNARDVAIALNCLASTCEWLALREEAQIYSEEALRTAVDSGYRFGEAEARRRLAALARDAGDAERADTLADEALAIFESIGAKHHVNTERLARAGEVDPGGTPVLKELWGASEDEIPPSARVTAGLHLAARGELMLDAVKSLYASVRAEIEVMERITLDVRLWKLTAERAYLLPAREDLSQLLDQAPDDEARARLARRPCCRDVIEALREAGEAGPEPIP